MKILKKLLLIALFIPTTINAYSDYIIASGDNIGINIKSKGVLVVGTYKVDNVDIALESQIKPGDIITKINDTKINNINDLVKVSNENCDKVNVYYERLNQTYQTTLKLKKENNICKTGLYVKDEITGIGTLTYIDPNTKLFGALGHEIIDSQTGKIIDISEGIIFKSEVIDIKKSTNNSPGEKNARYNKDEVIGNINENTNKGIFGNIDDINDENLYKVASPDEVQTGEAEIITVLEGTTKGRYKINITKLNDGETKNIVFKVTDPILLDKTGGIVQGMSGSPIIQNNKIIGAVTHVVVDDPLKGYGIFITNMLKEGEN
jgi:stage IV sporulation protein B